MTLGLIWIDIKSGTCVREEVRKGNLRVRTILHNGTGEQAWGGGWLSLGHSLWEWKLKAVGTQVPNIWFPLHLLPIVTLLIALPWGMKVELWVCLGKKLNGKKWSFDNEITRSNWEKSGSGSLGWELTCYTRTVVFSTANSNLGSSRSIWRGLSFLMLNMSVVD